MNLAYMILAHHQPAQLERLVDRLSQPNAYFFIHIDKKSKDKEAIKQRFAGNKNVTIIARNAINWMGFTMIEAELDLMKLAFNSGIQFKYYVLLSGQDYPIKSNAYINEFFSKHDYDFLNYNKISYMKEDFRKKHTRWHFMDIPYINPRSPKKIPFLVYLYFGTHSHLSKHLPARRFYKDMDTYFGSQWFALTHDTIKYILEFVEANKGFIKSMKNSEGPDETFFHTIIMNSPRKTNVIDYARFENWLTTRKGNEVFNPAFGSLRYMDWSEHLKSKPAVLDNEYVSELLDSDHLFARKFDEKTSAGLMEYLDKNVLAK